MKPSTYVWITVGFMALVTALLFDSGIPLWPISLVAALSISVGQIFYWEFT